MGERKIEEPWEARPRLVACIPPRPGMEARIQRMATFAARVAAQLSVVSVRPPKLSEPERRWLGEYAALVHREGGEVVSLYGRNPAATLPAYLRKTLSTEVVLGRRRRRWRPWDTTSTLIRLLEDVDVHILRRDEAAPPAGCGRRHLLATESGATGRSEEHTSELPSHLHIVRRPLL